MNTHWSNQTILSRFRVDLALSGAEEAYRAWDQVSSQAVTLHLLTDQPDDDTSRRLDSRGQALAHFSHPAVSPYLGYFEYASRGFWVEGYLDAPRLRDILSSIPGQPLELTESLIYLKNLAAGLTALHAAGWAHANLCPENIRISRTGKVLIFGLFSARHLGEVPPLSTRYTAPDRALSPAYDVYSLGRILFEMLAGGLPEPLPDLRSLNPKAPEFLARQLPRALDAYANTRVNSAEEFFLTACLACRVEASAVPERIPLDSASAFSLGVWEFLPTLEPPHTPVLQSPVKEKRLRPLWFWPALGLAGLALGIGAWLLTSWLRPPGTAEVLLLSDPATTTAPAQVVSAGIQGIPTQPAVPSLAAPEGLGGKIVFTCTRKDLNQLCMVAPTGGDISRVTSESAHDYYPNFSPAGNMLLYSSNRSGSFNLYLKLLGSDVLTQLTKDIGEVAASAFSPDGTQIVFSNSVNGKPFELWQVSRDGGDAHRLYSGDGHISSAAWAPNGKSIAIAMSSAADLAAYDVYILDLASLTAAPLTKGKLPNTGGSVDWSPDGRSLLLFAGPAGDKNIFLFDIVSGKITQLTNGGNNAAPAFSPDGRWVVFNSQRNGNADIFVMHPDGTGVRQVTSDPEPDWQPRWSR